MIPPVDSDSFHSDDGRIEVDFDPDELASSAITRSKIKLVIDAAVAALDAEHTEGPDRLTVMIVGDERIRDLNRTFKGEDEVTDVLSFNEAAGDAIGEENEYEWPDFSEIGPTGDVESERLGDIAISFPQVERQAAENGKSVDTELAMLTIHGVLHLLGYDHAEPGEEQIMFGKTDVILAEIFGD